VAGLDAVVGQELAVAGVAYLAVPAADAAAAAIEDVRRAVDTLTAVALDERAAASTTRGSSVDPGPSPVC